MWIVQTAGRSYTYWPTSVYLLLVCRKYCLFKSFGRTAFEASALPMPVALSKVNLGVWSSHGLWTAFKASVKIK